MSDVFDAVHASAELHEVVANAISDLIYPDPFGGEPHPVPPREGPDLPGDGNEDTGDR